MRDKRATGTEGHEMVGGGGVVGIFSIAKAFSKIFGAILCLFVLVIIVNMTSLVIRKYRQKFYREIQGQYIHTQALK